MTKGKSSLSPEGERDFRRKNRRLSAGRKAEIVIEILRGESLDEVSRRHGVAAHEAAEWRDTFLAQGKESLKSRPLAPVDRELRDAKAKIGDMAMTIDIFRAALRKKGVLSREMPA